MPKSATGWSVAETVNMALVSLWNVLETALGAVVGNEDRLSAMLADYIRSIFHDTDSDSVYSNGQCGVKHE
jgi:hypothetical protein